MRSDRGGSRLANLAGLLDSLSPLRTLERGYTILSDESGNVVRDSSNVNAGDRLGARLAKGRLGLRVEEVSGEE